MPLKGKAKLDYQREYMREYMRRKREGLNIKGLNNNVKVLNDKIGLNIKTIEAPAITPRVMKALKPTVEGIKQFGGFAGSMFKAEKINKKVTQPSQPKPLHQEAHTETQSKPAVSLPGVIEVKNKQEEVRATKRLLKPKQQTFKNYFKKSTLELKEAQA